ncbi:MAG: MATE family efflux transporter [Sutterella sp.]|nr:MATE family efflux transporter [Sutterella sp.]
MRSSRTSGELLAALRAGEPLDARDRVALVLRLSVPAVVAQISTIAMHYIDASMVGHLGARESAAIGLMMSTFWLFAGICASACMGFTVQAAHRIGAEDFSGARELVRQGLFVAVSTGLIMMTAGVLLHRHLPVWLGGSPDIIEDAAAYFRIFSYGMPLMVVSFVSGGMLRASGDIRTPSVLNVVMCVLDVVFNFLFIFPTRTYAVFGTAVTLPGFGLGVAGAAWATFLAGGITSLMLLWCLAVRSPMLAIIRERGRFLPDRVSVRRALGIGIPIGLERFCMTAGQIVLMTIVSPLGTFAIAAHSLAVTAESLCYMPGYGISEAATTITGQSLGAGRKDLAGQLAYLAVGLGTAVMTVMGAVMYVFAPELMRTLTASPEVIGLGSGILRIEAFAEPLFAAAIVCHGVFVGAGDTRVPCLMNLISMWAVRLTLAAWLAPQYGITGVWIAMALELCFRGLVFLGRLVSGAWKCGKALTRSRG